MRTSLPEVYSRLNIKRVESEGIQTFDIDNAYPQRTDIYIDGSPRAKQCVGVLERFVRGAGLKDEVFYKSVINSKGLTVDKLNRKLSSDLARHNGFAIHFKYNGLGQKIEATPIRFKEFRLPIPAEDGTITHVLHHPDWGREIWKNFRKDKITKYPLFNDNPDVVIQQMIDAGGISNYKGQVLWFSIDEGKYPLSSIDSVKEDVISDNEAMIYRLGNITTSFMNHTAVITDEMSNSTERKEFNDNLNKFQGARSGRKVIHIEKKSEEQTFEVKHFDHPTASDKEFEYTEKSVSENIRKPFMTPPVLLGDLVSGKMGTATEIQDAHLSYNAHTYDYRLILEETYTKIFSNWATDINPSKDYSIIPLSFETGNENQPMIQTLPQGSSVSLQALLDNTTIDPAAKKNRLIVIYGFTQDQANAVIEGTPLPDGSN